MNEGRQLYLKSYYRVDNLDASLEKSKMYYRSWKYWHMAMLHAKKIAVSVAYSMYIEVAEGNLDQDWKVDSPLSFWDFRDRLSKQMLEYNPINLLYPGDENMRSVTRIEKRKRIGRPYQKSKDTNPLFVCKEDLCEEIVKKRETDKRLCGDLTCLTSHVISTKKYKNGGVCAWCGK